MHIATLGVTPVARKCDYHTSFATGVTPRVWISNFSFCSDLYTIVSVIVTWRLCAIEEYCNLIGHYQDLGNAPPPSPKKASIVALALARGAWSGDETSVEPSLWFTVHQTRFRPAGLRKRVWLCETTPLRLQHVSAFDYAMRCSIECYLVIVINDVVGAPLFISISTCCMCTCLWCVLWSCLE